MGFLNNTPELATKTLRVMARLLSYPDPTLRKHLPELRDALRAEAALSLERLLELEDLIDWMSAKPGAQQALDIEEAYVALFDRGRATSLHLFEHVHGDSRDRGPAMIDLAQNFEKAGLYLAAGEMPDYLPVVLEYASTQPAAQARAFLNEMAHIFNAIFAALQQRDTRYASVLGALLELAGEKAKAVKVTPDESLDDSWEEPVVFDGCSTKGQANPGQPQPIHIIRKNASSNPTTGVSV